MMFYLLLYYFWVFAFFLFVCFLNNKEKQTEHSTPEQVGSTPDARQSMPTALKETQGRNSLYLSTMTRSPNQNTHPYCFLDFKMPRID